MGLGCSVLVHNMFYFVVDLLLANKSVVGSLSRLWTRAQAFVTPKIFSCNLAG